MLAFFDIHAELHYLTRIVVETCNFLNGNESAGGWRIKSDLFTSIEE